MNINRPCGTFDRTYFQAKELYRTPLRKILLALLIVGMYFLPFLGGDYGISILTLICAFTIGMLGLQIITGYCGQISIGHAAFIGVGMYTVGILQRHFGLSFWVCLPLAGLVPMFIGMMFGLPALRMKGLYLAFATLAAHFVIVYVISNWRSIQAKLRDNSTQIQTSSTMFQADNPSTFMHEAGHWFLDSQEKIVALLEALPQKSEQQQKLIDDWNATLQYLGTDAQSWSKMSIDQRRTYHEKMAELFEAYIMRGIAPSKQLEGVMARMSEWIKTWYRAVTKMLGLAKDMNPEIVEIMDRIFATDKEIADAAALVDIALPGETFPFTGSRGWTAPKGTPQSHIDWLYKLVKATAATPLFQKHIGTVPGLRAVCLSPAESNALNQKIYDLSKPVMVKLKLNWEAKQ